MMPMRANITGPPCVATKDQRFHGRLPFRRLMLGLRLLGDVIACVP
jgi:hypothetical protein